MPDGAKGGFDASMFAGRAVRVTVPAAVAFDLGRMTKVTASILDRLGCGDCHSGWDIRYDIARNFVVDEGLKVQVAGVVIIHG